MVDFAKLVLYKQRELPYIELIKIHKFRALSDVYTYVIYHRLEKVAHKGASFIGLLF